MLSSTATHRHSVLSRPSHLSASPHPPSYTSNLTSESESEFPPSSVPSPHHRHKRTRHPGRGGGWGPDTVNVAACTLTLSDMRLMLNFGCDCHSLGLLPGWDGRRLFSGYVYLAVLVLTHAHRKRNSNPVGSMLFSFSFLAREPLHSSRIKPTLI